PPPPPTTPTHPPPPPPEHFVSPNAPPPPPSNPSLSTTVVLSLSRCAGASRTFLTSEIQCEIERYTTVSRNLPCPNFHLRKTIRHM
ncbi:hypothetical protein PMAYCL1PPCAC_29485, partial [Pristionchus mayeri]